MFGATVLLAASPAFAQVGDTTGGGDGSGSATGAPMEPGAGNGSGGVTAGATTGGDVAGWNEIGTRPLVIPQGKAEAHLGLPIFAFQSVNPATMMPTTDTAELLSLGGTFGVVDKVEIGGDYAFRINPNASGKGILGLHGAYAALKNDKMELAVAGGLALAFFGTDAMGNTTTNAALQLGAWFRYQVAPKISIFTGQPAVPFTLGGFSSFIAPPLGYQLQIGINNSQPVLLSLPAGAGFQATPQLWVFAALDLADIYLSNGPANGVNSTKSANVIFADYIPVALGGFFSVSDKMDVGVEFADDFKHAGDLYAITLAGRFYVK